MSKASPLSAVGFAAFLKLADLNSVSNNLPEFCAKISNDAVRLEDLFEALVDLCDLTNVCWGACHSEYIKTIEERSWILCARSSCSYTLFAMQLLVSHPQYSVPVVQALTSTREMASMTVDVACRLTQRNKLFWLDSCTTKQMRESETVDLAWVFRKRVFMFLGDSVS